MTRASESRRRRLARSVGAAGVLAAVMFTAGPAAAFVRYLSESHCPYSWRKRAITIDAYPRAVADLTTEQAASAIEGSIEVWTKRNAALAGCTDLDLKMVVHAPPASPPTARFDQRNVVALRTDKWCAPNDDGTPDPRCADPHDPSALAITSVFARGYGEIVDADIEVNAVNFVWGDLVTAAEPTAQDLQNALTHEVGHFIGLDHTCYMGELASPPRDHNGEEIPPCDSAPAGVKATTMFASAMPGDISKRSLEDDDQAAVCAIYPAGAPDVLACSSPDPGGGCTVAAVDAGSGAGTTWPWLGVVGGLLAVGLSWVGARRRVTQRRRRERA